MPTRARWIITGFALLAASSFALAVEWGQWWSIGEVAIGPFGTRHCFGGDCRSSGLGWTGGSELWMRSAAATGVAGLLALVVLVVMAGAVAAGRVPRLVARMTVSTIVTAAAVGGYFFAAFPGIDGVSIGSGVILFAAGVVLGLAAAVGVLRTPTA